MSKVLIYNDSFKEILVKLVGEITHSSQITVGKRFESWDSFSFLVTTHNNKKYVAKIFRFPDWPSKGKLETVSKLLAEKNIRHEKVLHIAHAHEVFTHGWLLSEFIAGGTAKEVLDAKIITKEKYYQEVGMLLKDTHSINMGFFGSINIVQDRYQSFKDMALAELEDQPFNKLAGDLLSYEKPLQQIRAEIVALLNEIGEFEQTLVHDDVGSRNILWNYGKPILIDWVDSVAGPPLRDFATVTFRLDQNIIPYLESGYGKEIDKRELRLHQLMRFVRLGHFYLYEDMDIKEFRTMIDRAFLLLKQKVPFGM